MMTRQDARAVVDLLGAGVSSGPLGITWGPIRVYCGSGIAGHSGDWWIDFPGEPAIRRRGPFRTQTQLRRAIRRVVLDACLAILSAGRAINLLTPADDAGQEGET